MKGRPRKPIERHLAEGTFNATRHKVKTPTLVGGRARLDPPPNLSAEERELWVRIVEDLDAAQIIDHADFAVVESAAVQIARARAARRSIHRRGLLVQSRLGETIANPAVRIERDAWGSFLRFAEQLGLSPSARARLGAESGGAVGQSPEGEFDELEELRQKRESS